MQDISFIFAILVTVMVLTFAFNTRKWKKNFEAQAARFGLDYQAGTWLARPRLSGTYRDVDVVVDVVRGKSQRSPKTTRVRANTGFPFELDLRQETLGASIGKAFLGNDLPIGDPNFDGQVLVRGGDKTEVVASLTADARRCVIDGLNSGMRFRDGYASVGRRGRVRKDGTMQALLDRVVDAHLATAPRGDVLPEKLAYNAVNDPVRAVQINNFEMLLSRFASTPASASCARELAAGEDPVMRRMACNVLPDDLARASLEGALIDAKARDGLVPDHAILARQLARRFPDATVLEDVTPWLLTQLHKNTSAAVGAAEALGAFAGIGVVEPMLAAARGRAKKAIREAVVQIQGRSSGGLGQLTVVETDAQVGALAIAEQPGQVSLVTEVAEADPHEV